MTDKKPNHFEVQGTVNRVDKFTSKAGKDIVTLVLDVPDDKYPQVIPIKAFGHLADEFANLQHGAEVKVKGRLGGREWSGKVYGDNVAESVEVVGEAQKQDVPPPAGEDEPF